MTIPGATLYVVDGTFELFRCFHGAPRATDADGNEIGAARALLWTLLKLLRTEDLTHVAMAYDRMARPRKNDGSADALLRSQNALAGEVARAVGITIWPVIRWQADDAAATAARQYRDDFARIVLCTTDKDLLQCVRGEHVVVWDRIRDRVTDEDGVRERMGVDPDQIPDLFSLIGDPSDGLSGVPGWGPKSAAAVLGRYRTLAEIPDNDAEWDCKVRGAARLARNLKEGRDEAKLARALSVLRDDLPLPQSAEDLRWRGPTDELDQLAARLGADEVVEKVRAIDHG